MIARNRLQKNYHWAKGKKRENAQNGKHLNSTGHLKRRVIGVNRCSPMTCSATTTEKRFSQKENQIFFLDKFERPEHKERLTTHNSCEKAAPHSRPEIKDRGLCESSESTATLTIYAKYVKTHHQPPTLCKYKQCFK